MATAKKTLREKAKRHDRKKELEKLPETAFDQVLFRWVAPEFLRYHRGPLWFVIGGLLEAALLAYAWWSGSWSMLLVFIVLPVVVILEHRRKPQNVEVVVSPYGIRFGEHRVPFSSMRRFWIFSDPDRIDELHLLIDDRWHPELMIPLTGVPMPLLRRFLTTQVIEWEGKERSTLELLIHALKLS